MKKKVMAILLFLIISLFLIFSGTVFAVKYQASCNMVFSDPNVFCEVWNYLDSKKCFGFPGGLCDAGDNHIPDRWRLKLPGAQVKNEWIELITGIAADSSSLVYEAPGDMESFLPIEDPNQKTLGFLIEGPFGDFFLSSRYLVLDNMKIKCRFRLDSWDERDEIFQYLINKKPFVAAMMPGIIEKHTCGHDERIPCTLSEIESWGQL